MEFRHPVLAKIAYIRQNKKKKADNRFLKNEKK